MAFLAASFIILAAISQNYFYINKPYNLRDGYVCFSDKPTNKTCELWPQNWQRLYPKTINNGNLNILHTKLDPVLQNSSILFYKLKFFYPDQTVGETKQWSSIALNIDNQTKNKLSIDCDCDTKFYKKN